MLGQEEAPQCWPPAAGEGLPYESLLPDGFLLTVLVRREVLAPQAGRGDHTAPRCSTLNHERDHLVKEKLCNILQRVSKVSVDLVLQLRAENVSGPRRVVIQAIDGCVTEGLPRARHCLTNNRTWPEPTHTQAFAVLLERQNYGA